MKSFDVGVPKVGSLVNRDDIRAKLRGEQTDEDFITD